MKKLIKKRVSAQTNELIKEINGSVKEVVKVSQKDDTRLIINKQGHMVPQADIEIANETQAELMFIQGMHLFSTQSGVQFRFLHKGKPLNDVFDLDMSNKKH